MTEPDFRGLDAPDVRKLVNDVLDRCMEPRYRDEWWRTEFFYSGQTPEQMLAAGRHRQLWLLANAMGAREEVDLTAFEHVRG